MLRIKIVFLKIVFLNIIFKTYLAALLLLYQKSTSHNKHYMGLDYRDIRIDVRGRMGLTVAQG